MFFYQKINYLHIVMGYLVELSIPVVNFKNLIAKKEEIINNALKKDCEFFYENSEHYTTGHGKHIKKENNIILSFHFPHKEKKVISFIRFIKEQKKIYIDCIAYDNIKFILLWGSKKYFNHNGKNMKDIYLKNKRNDILPLYGPGIIQEIYNRYSRV